MRSSHKPRDSGVGFLKLMTFRRESFMSWGRAHESGSLDSKYADRPDSDSRDLHQINRITVLAMALASGVSVANLYYCQPLLAQMGRTFGVGHAAGYIPAFTLIGLILGMVLFVPLGDMVERRRLIVAACAFRAVA